MVVLSIGFGSAVRREPTPSQACDPPMTPKFLKIDGHALARHVRVLVVEPDPAERARLRTGLEPRFSVTEAQGANDAVLRLRERYFDAILTAYELGDPDGVWLLHYVFEHHEYVHRTLMTAKFVPDLRSLLDAGIVTLVEKKPLAAEDYAAYFVEPWMKGEEIPET